MNRLSRSLLLLASLLLAATSASADPPGRVGRLADFNGAVWFLDAEQGEWTQAQRNRPLTGGDRLSTERDARAELQIGSTMLRLDGGTEIDLVQLDDERIRVQLNGGSLALRVRSQEVADEIEIVTAEGRFMPLSTGHFRVDRRGDASVAGSWSGDLRFESHDSTLTIGSGRRAEFWADGAQRTTHYTWSTLDADRFAQWAAEQDRRDDRAAASRHVSPEMTGADDLDRYGRWESDAEYGSVWLPHQVSPGWAPYRVGHWAWVRPWGWTWVDDAPWGFAPFHYGRWVSWHGRWGWVPGSYVARPIYAPALVAWIGGGSVSVGVHIGSRPHVGWVPLAPWEPWVPHYRVSPRYHRDINHPHWRDGRHRDNRDHRGPGRRPAEPIMYTNRGVPGGVTVVPSNVLRDRQPVARAVVPATELAQVPAQRWRSSDAPPPPVRRVGAGQAGGGDAVVVSPRRVPPQVVQPAPQGGDRVQVVPRPAQMPDRVQAVPPPQQSGAPMRSGRPIQLEDRGVQISPPLQQPPAAPVVPVVPRAPAVVSPPPQVVQPERPGRMRQDSDGPGDGRGRHQMQRERQADTPGGARRQQQVM